MQSPAQSQPKRTFLPFVSPRSDLMEGHDAAFKGHLLPPSAKDSSSLEGDSLRAKKTSFHLSLPAFRQSCEDPASPIPVIFLSENTPEGSHSTTPASTPVLKADRTLLEDDSAGCGKKDSSGASCEDNSCDNYIEFGRDERDDCDDHKPIKGPQNRAPTGSLPHDDRRASLLSIPSMTPGHRRASLTSLLSLTPSVTVGGKRFSFSIGNSRSDQMVSVNFRKLESFILEDNLSGLYSFLGSRPGVVDDRDENGTTALMVAASCNRPDFCSALIEYGADVNAEDNDQWTPLISAAKEGHEEVVKFLLDPTRKHDDLNLKSEVNLNSKDMGGWTALMWACYKGHTAIARELLSWGADPNQQGHHHMTALVWAAGRGHTEITRDLLTKGAKVNIGDKFGTTALIWASRKGFFEICEDLLTHGANVDAAGMYSWTPLLVAVRGGYIDLVRLLLERRPNVNALDKDGGTALTIASKEGNLEVVLALLSAGAYVNIQDRNGDTSLIYACRGGHRQVVEVLLKKYADVDIVGKDKKTALYWAVEKGHTDVVELLLNSNPDLEHSTKDGDTALLRAVRNKQADVVQMLVNKNARVTIADKKGDTALHIAMRGRSKRIVDILLRDPKNGKMLYRPNFVGETPYNIDFANQKPILGHIYGARRLNTNEENENMLGYDLYSYSLADILSEPSLSTPISVGLFAKWGSGKQFIIPKLKKEMDSFAKSWVEPLFQFSPLLLLVILHISFFLGLLCSLPTYVTLARKSFFSPYLPIIVGGFVLALVLGISVVFLLVVWYGSRKYNWKVWNDISATVARQMASVKLVLQVIFCSPPGSQWRKYKDGNQALPHKFIFAEGAKPSSTSPSENSIVLMIGSLFDRVEREYGLFATRFYRALQPDAQSSSSPWRYRRLCCVPYIVIFYLTMASLLTVIVGGIVFFFQESGDGLLSREVRSTEFDDDDPPDPEDNSAEHSTEEGSDDLPSIVHIGYSPVDYRSICKTVLITLAVLLAVVLLAYVQTFARIIKSLIFSHRRHLNRKVAQLDTLKAEGYLSALKAEVNLMVNMVKCLDAFTSQQTRLVIIVDGLGSCEQEKVLNVLDAVNDLFTETSSPFVILLAIDPHIIIKAIETGVHRLFRESTVSGHDYLRNSVHLPIYLQNSGLRKLNQAKQIAERQKGRQSTWLEIETDSVKGGLSHVAVNRRLSGESALSQSVRRNHSKSSGKNLLKQSDSLASSIASNLNRTGGAQDLTEVFLTDDYFSDITPRSMRRLMNVLSITARHLKAFQIEFNWCHLASWINITEQWPYRTSLLIYYCDEHEEALEDKTSLKDLFDKVKNQGYMGSASFQDMDKEEAKFEIFLKDHRSSLNVANMKIFLPFTINLDPYIRKVIKEDHPELDAPYSSFNTPNPLNPWGLPQFEVSQLKGAALSRQKATNRPSSKLSTASLPQQLNPLFLGYPSPFMPSAPTAYTDQASVADGSHVGSYSLPAEACGKKLSLLNVEEVFEIFTKIVGVSTTKLPTYRERLIENNINGIVLCHCSMEDLKTVLQMNFGDWELFKMMIFAMRDRESYMEDEDGGPPSHPHVSQQDSNEDLRHPPSYSSENPPSNTRRGYARTHSASFKEKEEPVPASKLNKPSHLSKQVTLEEKMIFGALQTLNEEAYEDVQDERLLMARAAPAPSHLTTIPSEEDMKEESVIHDNEDVDIVYMQSSPMLSDQVIAGFDLESGVTSYNSSFSPHKLSSVTSLSRASSLYLPSTNASPKSSLGDPNRISTSFKGDRILKEDESISSPTSPLYRNRPKSLNLGRKEGRAGLYFFRRRSKAEDILFAKDEDERSPSDEKSIINNLVSSLPDLTAGVKAGSLATQCQASSVSKLRKLRQKLHRALTTVESKGAAEDEEGHLAEACSEPDSCCSPPPSGVFPGSDLNHHGGSDRLLDSSRMRSLEADSARETPL